MANRRDLHIGIDGDAKGFDAACEEAEAKAKGLDRELAKMERQQAANEKVTTRASAAVDRFARAEDKAALAAHRMGLEAKRAADQAEKAETRAAAAAEAAAKGLLDEAKAAKLAARADDAVERASLKAAEAHRAQARAADQAADQERQLARDAELAGMAQRLAALKASGAVKTHNSLVRELEKRYGDLSKEGNGAFKQIEQGTSGVSDALAKVGSSGPGSIALVVAALAAVPFAAVLAESAVTLGVGGALAGLGLYATKGNKQVQAALGGMTDHIKSQTKQISQPFVSTWLEIAKTGRETFDALAPDLEQDFAKLAPAVSRFSHDAGYAITLLGPAFNAATDGAVTLMDALGPRLPDITRNLGSAISIMAKSAADSAPEFANVAVGVSQLLPPLAHALDLAVKVGPVFNPLFDAVAHGATTVGALRSGLENLTGGLISTDHSLQIASGTFPSFAEQAGQASVPTSRLAEDMAKVANGSADMKDRLDAATDALSAYYAPASAAWDATTKLEQGMADLAKLMKAAKGNFSGNTDASRELRKEFDQQLTSIADLRQANLQTKGYTAAQKAAEGQVQVMYALAGKSKAARGQIDALAQSMGLTVGKANLSHDAFLAAARGLGKTKGEAEALWKAYQRLQQPVKLTANDADFLSKLHNAQGLTIDPKTGYLRGNNSDYLNKWLKAKGLTINPKTGLFRGNNADYYNKWLAANHLKINTKTGKITGNTASFWSAVHNIPSVVGTRTIDVRLSGARPDLQADGNVIAASGMKRFADGGQNRHDLPPHITQQPAVLYGEPETGGEAYIPLGQRKRRRSVMLLSDVAGMFGLALVKPMADGGITSFADGGTTDIGLSTILSDWSSAVKPSTKAQLDSATKARRTQVNQLAAAEDALAKARRKGSARDIAAAERRITAERQDLAAATAKLTDVESRYKYTKQSPATQLGSALAGTIKNTGAFIKNLTTLTSKGYGVLAQQLLAMGGTDAEKIAADAVKFSNAKLGKLQSQIGQTQDLQTQLGNLPAILTAQTAIKAGAGGSWVGLLNATGLTPDVLAVAVKSMLSDLGKTAQGKALVADMHAHGYVRGGIIAGPAGVDRVPLWGTAGEMVINRQSTAANRPALEAINRGVRVPIASVPVRGGDGASAGPQISQTFQTQDMDTHQLARESAREIAWMLR